MSANPNWDRWFFASVSNYFNTVAEAAGIPLFVEGDVRITAQQQDYFEFRMNGPIFQEASKDWWRIDVEINILCISKDKTDFHKIHKMTGIMVAGFNNFITVYKYGDTPMVDDQSVLGCLILSKKLDDNIAVTHLGQLATDLTENQAAVEGYYRMFLDT